MVKKKLTFKEKLAKIQKKNNSLLCVGLDSNFEKLSEDFLRLPFSQLEFNKWIIDQTAEFVCAYKPNLAFYEARGSRGWAELEMTLSYLQENYPDIITIADAKRADIGSSNDGYVSAIFDQMGFDAITLHPYLGSEALRPFLKRKDKGNIILCRTSNPGAWELQDVVIPAEAGIHGLDKKNGLDSGSGSGMTIFLWQVVAQNVTNEWNKNDNCLLVVGATYPEELATIRSMVGEMDLLIPGIGAQGGDLKKVMKAGLNKKKRGMIISSSRSIIFAKNPGKEAKKLRDLINKYR